VTGSKRKNTTIQEPNPKSSPQRPQPTASTIIRSSTQKEIGAIQTTKTTCSEPLEHDLQMLLSPNTVKTEGAPNKNDRKLSISEHIDRKLKKRRQLQIRRLKKRSRGLKSRNKKKLLSVKRQRLRLKNQTRRLKSRMKKIIMKKIRMKKILMKKIRE